MGRSRTYHVIGAVDLGDGTERLYPAMSRVEMAQQAAKARRFDGVKISRWYAQTSTGELMVKGGPSRRLRSCPVCGGRGQKFVTARLMRSCVVCSGSGLCRRGHERRWADWQVDEMRKDWEKD